MKKVSGLLVIVLLLFMSTGCTSQGVVESAEEVDYQNHFGALKGAFKLYDISNGTSFFYNADHVIVLLIS